MIVIEHGLGGATTSLFCSDTCSTCFENPEYVFKLLVSSTMMKIKDLMRPKIMENLYCKAICKNFSLCKYLLEVGGTRIDTIYAGS